ncbi:MAG: ABC transporter ATP-binding protein [Betaproteobacteria bacterium]|nr:ABC transporter ATP-binding protein [Betaproteobacteria bacterium]
MIANGDLLLSVRNLKVDFRLEDGAVLHAVNGVSFDVPANQTVTLVGESGSGKSVTALAILGLLPAANARVLPGSTITYRGRDLHGLTPRELTALRGAEISMVFQEPMSSLNPVFSVGFQLGEVLRKHLGLTKRRARARAIELLDEVGIPDPRIRVDAYPHQLSGGQQQRVMIAMAIACEPRLLIADEPTTALDISIQNQILMLLSELKQRRQMAMLFITHDLGLVAEVADQVVVMRDGVVRERGAVKQIFSAPQDAYTRALLACRPSMDRRPRYLPVVDDFLNGANANRDVHASVRERGLRGDEAMVLQVDALSKHFQFREGLLRKRDFKALGGASFKLAKGKTLGVVGESGSGKTTMALTLMRLTPASGGMVLFDGRDLLQLSPDEALRYKRRIQIVFQNPYASLNPRFTAGEILLEPMRIHGIATDETARVGLVRELLYKVGLPHSAFFKYPHEFSGGQRQRIAIARCLTLKPEVLICDEAVSALDLSVQAQLLNLLQDLQDEFGMSYIFISHDLAVVKYMSDEVMVMKDGEVVEMGYADEIYARPRHAYTRQLLAAMPRRALAGSATA